MINIYPDNEMDALIEVVIEAFDDALANMPDAEEHLKKNELIMSFTADGTNVEIKERTI